MSRQQCTNRRRTLDYLGYEEYPDAPDKVALEVELWEELVPEFSGMLIDMCCVVDMAEEVLKVCSSSFEILLWCWWLMKMLGAFLQGTRPL